MSDELPPGWAWGRLQDLAASQPYSMTDGPFGSNLKSSDYMGSGVRVIRLGNLGVGKFSDTDRAYISEAKFADLAKHEVRPGDLVIAALGDPVGRCCQIPDLGTRAIVKADCIKFTPHDAVERRFLMHALNSPQGRTRAEQMGHGLGRLRINMENMRSLPVPIPPVNEQRRIVAKLEALLARSRRAKGALDAIPALLERFQQSVLAAAFRGDLTRDWRAANPDVEPASKLLEWIRTERRRRWEAAELERLRAKGKVPKDERWKDGYEAPVDVDAAPPVDAPSSWTWTTLESVTFIKGGLALGKKRVAGDVLIERPYLRVANVQRGHLDLSEIKTVHVTPEEAHELRLEPGDVLLNEGGDRDKLGRGWIWSGEVPDCIHQNHVFRARPISGGIHPKLLSWYGNTFGQRYFLDEGKQTTNLASVSMTKVKRLPVPVIPVEEQDVLVKRIEALLSVVANLAKQHEEVTARLPELERSLLAKAFAGELVPQDPDDEPASVLLDRIRAERESATVAAKSSRTAKLPKTDSTRVA